MVEIFPKSVKNFFLSSLGGCTALRLNPHGQGFQRRRIRALMDMRGVTQLVMMPPAQYEFATAEPTGLEPGGLRGCRRTA